MTLVLIFWKFGATLAIVGTLAAVALFGTGPLEGSGSPAGESAGQSVEFVVDPGTRSPHAIRCRCFRW